MTDRNSKLDAYSNFVSQLTPPSRTFHHELASPTVIAESLECAALSGKDVDVVKKGLYYGKDCDQLRDLRSFACDNAQHRTDHLNVDLIHAILGVVSEAAELAELLFKSIKSGEPINTKELILEAGDCLWYLQLLANAEEVGIGGLIDENVKKLSKRFPNAVFTEEAAIARVDVG